MMSIATRLFLTAPFLIGLAHAAPVRTADKAASPAGTVVSPARTDRKLLRNAISRVRIHHDGDAVVAKPEVKRIELANGAVVALTYSQAYSSAERATVGVVNVYGAVGGSDVALNYLDAKQRSETRAVLAPLRDAFVAKGHDAENFRIEFDHPATNALKVKVAELSASESRLARNYLTLRDLAPTLDVK